MAKALSEAQVDHYRTRGFLSPIRVIDDGKIKELRTQLEEYERKQGRVLTYEERLKPYLAFPWADHIVHHPAVLDAVEQIIGPNILIYMTTLWMKEPDTDAVVAWHQDGPYVQLEPTEQITAWVALSHASEEAGCLRVIPESHLAGEVPHGDYSSPSYLIRRGLGVDPDMF